jgi:hypothetical protein
MKEYHATQKSNVLNWAFTGTLTEIADCLTGDGKAQILEIEAENEDYPEEAKTPGIYYTPNCEAWDLERAGGLDNKRNILGRTPMEAAIIAILQHDGTQATLEELS